MTDTVVHEHLVSMAGDKLRVEKGPRRIMGNATPELLRKTKRRVPGEHFIAADGTERVARVVYDAMGKRVTLGKPMTYLDANPRNRVWYLYRWETVETDHGPVEKFVEKGIFDGSREDAVAECKAKWGAT